jgi:hypothetical protein
VIPRRQVQYINGFQSWASDNDEDSVLAFPGLAPPVARKESIPHSVLVPLAKELATILEGNCIVEELEQYKEMLSNFITKKKHEIMKQQRGSTTGTIVSSSVRSNKKLKTHGTKRMSFG